MLVLEVVLSVEVVVRSSVLLAEVPAEGRGPTASVGACGARRSLENPAVGFAAFSTESSADRLFFTPAAEIVMPAPLTHCVWSSHTSRAAGVRCSAAPR